jgi:hypothetical protein
MKENQICGMAREVDRCHELYNCIRHSDENEHHCYIILLIKHVNEAKGCHFYAILQAMNFTNNDIGRPGTITIGQKKRQTSASSAAMKHSPNDHHPSSPQHASSRAVKQASLDAPTMGLVGRPEGRMDTQVMQRLLSKRNANMLWRRTDNIASWYT